METILLVDDDDLTLTLGSDLLVPNYKLITADSGSRMFRILELITPDLILLDILMPEMSGFEVIKLLKENEATRQIPVIFLSATNREDHEQEGLSLGAIDFVSKPFSPSLLLKRIEIHLLIERQKKELETQRSELAKLNDSLQEMVASKTEAVLELQNAVLKTFSELIESRDGVTGYHIDRTQEYLQVLLEAMREHPLYCTYLMACNSMLILQCAQLHDVGKIAISDNILQKPGRLTEDERDKMKQHVMFGERIIDNIMRHTKERVFLEQAKVLVSTHHERWDGSGYPNGLKGREIPLLGRMMALVDVYDALISDRPYKKACEHDAVVKIITDARGAQFDPDLVDVFLDINEKFEAISTRSGQPEMHLAQ